MTEEGLLATLTVQVALPFTPSAVSVSVALPALSAVTVLPSREITALSASLSAPQVKEALSLAGSSAGLKV